MNAANTKLLAPYVPAACHRPLINSRWEELKVTFLEKNVALIYHQGAISSTASSLTRTVLTLLFLPFETEPDQPTYTK